MVDFIKMFEVEKGTALVFLLYVIYKESEVEANFVG